MIVLFVSLPCFLSYSVVDLCTSKGFFNKQGNLPLGFHEEVHMPKWSVSKKLAILLFLQEKKAPQRKFWIVKCVLIPGKQIKLNTVENSENLSSSYFLLGLHFIVWIWLNQMSLPGTAKMMFEYDRHEIDKSKFGPHFHFRVVFLGFPWVLKRFLCRKCHFPFVINL